MNGKTLLAGSYEAENRDAMADLAAALDRNLPDLRKRYGRVAVVADNGDGVAHIISR